MYKAVHHDGQKRLVDTAEYLGRHNLIYKKPVLEPYHGIPLGNGKFGGLLYHNSHGLAMQVNHTDAIDFGEDGPLKVWAWESEEKNTAPSAAGKISIISDLPCCDWVYQEEYQERLELGSACASGTGKTPFCEVTWKCFASEKPGVLVYEIDAYQEEEAAWTVRAEKWSSPNFFHHYEQVVPVYGKNLDKISAEIQGDCLVLNQKLNRTNVAMTVKILGEAAQPELINSRGGVFRLPPKKEFHFKVLVNVEAGSGNVKEKSLQVLSAVSDTDKIFERHCAAWHKFWNRSFWHLEGEDYLENLYYLNLYQLNSCSRGKYPITFAGLWNWFKDTRNWGHFYHWNHQQNYWGMLETGHSELLRNYLEYRFEMLSQARLDAKQYFHAEGAFYSDVSNYNGFNGIEPDTLKNCSVAAQIALDFYRYYIYTQDEEFLQKRTVPMLEASVSFYHSLLIEEDGVLKIRGGSAAYESYWNLKETLTDYCALKAAINAVLSIGENGFSKEFLGICEELQEKLYSPATETIEHNGKPLEIFSIGRKWDGSKVGYGEGEYPWSPFPASLTAPVYPSGLVHLGMKDTDTFRIMKNTARVLLDKDVYVQGQLGCSGHTPTPEMAARLGMKEDIIKVLHKFAAAYQIFHNGLMHFADVSENQQWSPVDRPRILGTDETCTQWEELHEKSKGIRTAIPSQWFLHAYFEGAGNLTAGMNEMMLQSHEGVIRIFPALPNGKTAMFTLTAEGGFVVTAEAGEGEIRYVQIVSMYGGSFKIHNPWPGEILSVRKNQGEVQVGENTETLSFETEKGDSYLFCRAEYPVECYYHNPFQCIENRGIKTFQNVQLGEDKYY